MLANLKLKKYLEDNGIQKKWFAQKMGIPPSQLSHIVNLNKSIPKKYWKVIITLTNGKIKLEDFIEESPKDE